jgi:solute carrier family 25 protein 38
MRPLISGAVGGSCTTVLLQPLDLLKTRIQAPSPPEKYVKTFEIFTKIIKTEGALKLWRGLTPTLIRVVPGIGCYFFTLEALQKISGVRNPGHLHNLLLGFTARSLVGVVFLPVTVLKTRFESNFYKGYGNMKVGVAQIMFKNGFSGLYSGLVPTLLRDAPFSALYLTFYRFQQSLIKEDVLHGRWSTTVYLMCGINAGIVACLITHPFDMIKTQMQLFPEKYPSTFQTSALLYKSQGISAFFRGIVPRACRRTLMSALSWTVYERLSIGVRS